MKGIYDEFHTTHQILVTGSARLDLLRKSGDSKKWSTNYRSLLVNQESGNIGTISDFAKLELLSLRLPELVGSPLSLNGLREDLQIAHKTVSRWMDILENIYMIFRLSPFGSPLIRAVKKEQKHYHFDWTLVQDMSARFENLIASHLLKWVHYQRDLLGEEMGLRYLWNVSGRMEQPVSTCII